MSQRAFAEKVGADQSVISRIEAGLIRPSLNLAVRIQQETDGSVPATCWVDLAKKQQLGTPALAPTASAEASQ